MNYIVTLDDLTILTEDCGTGDVKETLSDLLSRYGKRIRELRLQDGDVSLVAQTESDEYREPDEELTCDVRIYVHSEVHDLRIAKYEQSLYDLVHNLSDFGLWK